MKISVVVCTKNEEKFIGPCLRCIKKQTVKPEIIIIDGHSKDRTVNISKKFTNKIYFDNGTGIAYARNLGWKKATGDIIAYCDADSRPPRDWIKKILKNIHNSVCISGPLTVYDGNKKVKRDLKIWTNYFFRIAAKLNYPCINGSNMAFPKNILKKNPFKVNAIEDFELGNRLRRIGKIKYIKNMIVPISSRRFQESFYRLMFEEYLLNYMKIKMGVKVRRFQPATSLYHRR